jgi:hypothetical protein
LLLFGITLPIAKIDEFWFFSSNFSILSIVKDLFINNEYLLAIIIISFGFFFPTIKIISRHLSLRIINEYNLHKFSMVDIFIISFLVFASKASSFFNMEIELGFYFLLLSVLLGYSYIIFTKNKS